MAKVPARDLTLFARGALAQLQAGSKEVPLWYLVTDREVEAVYALLSAVEAALRRLEANVENQEIVESLEAALEALYED